MRVVQAGDSNGEKLGGSLLNALVFIAIVTAMTFVMVLLFKYGVRSDVPTNLLPSAHERSYN